MCAFEKEWIAFYFSFFLFLLNKICNWASWEMPEREVLSVIQCMNMFQKLPLIYIKREGNAKLCMLSHWSSVVLER